jgi:hypothetical protein
MNTLLSKTRWAPAIFATALALLMGLVTTWTQAMEVGGTHYQPSIQVSSTRLLLNGVGVRNQASSGLYAAGLYLEKPLTRSEDVLAYSGAAQLRLVMLHDISARSLAQLLSQGLTGNVSDEVLLPLISEIFGVGLPLSEHNNFRAGDTIQIDALPAGGVTIAIIGSGRALPLSTTLLHPDTFKVMMSIWLGSQPADPGLKSALLGQSL